MRSKSVSSNFGQDLSGLERVMIQCQRNIYSITLEEGNRRAITYTKHIQYLLNLRECIFNNHTGSPAQIQTKLNDSGRWPRDGDLSTKQQFVVVVYNGKTTPWIGSTKQNAFAEWICNKWKKNFAPTRHSHTNGKTSSASFCYLVEP